MERLRARFSRFAGLFDAHSNFSAIGDEQLLKHFRQTECVCILALLWQIIRNRKGLQNAREHVTSPGNQ